MTNMITMSKSDFDAALETAKQAGREEAILEIKRISSLCHDMDQQEIVVQFVGEFRNAERRLRMNEK